MHPPSKWWSMYAEFFLNENDFAVNRPVLIYKFNSLGPFCICQCLDYNFQAPSALKQMPCISVCGTWSNESKIDQILHLLINTEPWFFFFYGGQKRWWWWSKTFLASTEMDRVDLRCTRVNISTIGHHREKMTERWKQYFGEKILICCENSDIHII